jgi:SAM-dependent methyltransferase
MSAAVNYHRWILDEFEPFLGKIVAEVGAGIGSVSQLILERPIERLFAFEPSRNMFPALEKLLKDEPRAEAVNDFLTPAFSRPGFDSILYLNVLEHIADDVAELGNVNRTMKSGGHLLIFVPALSALFSEFDRELGHFRRYTKTELADKVSASGFEIISSRYFDIAGVIPWYLNFVLLRNRMGKNAVSAYDKAVVPVMRVIEGLVAPPIGKNVLLVARKNENPKEQRQLQIQLQ